MILDSLERVFSVSAIFLLIIFANSNYNYLKIGYESTNLNLSWISIRQQLSNTAKISTPKLQLSQFLICRKAYLSTNFLYILGIDSHCILFKPIVTVHHIFSWTSKQCRVPCT